MDHLGDDATDGMTGLVGAIHRRHVANLGGTVAGYIPELARMPPDLLGLAVAGTDGRLARVGDAEHAFTIQSISKAFTFALLIETAGRAETYAAVGVQASSEAFNAIELDPRTNRPFNPMMNAGALAVTGRLAEIWGEAAFPRILAMLSAAAGRDLAVDEAVFRSERETGHRNRAIAHLLRAAGVFSIDPDQVASLYFRQCAVLVTAADLARMGATLGHLGTNPATGAEVFGTDAVRDTLSVMFTCGMYNGAGDWACRVGVPAKSGVGGGVLAVVNRQLGIGVFSPRLDAQGNPLRGLLCCIDLAEELGLHAFDATNAGSRYLSAWQG
ncbi:glutaminase A [Roseomonas sp. WA12]